MKKGITLLYRHKFWDKNHTKSHFWPPPLLFLSKKNNVVIFCWHGVDLPPPVLAMSTNILVFFWRYPKHCFSLLYKLNVKVKKKQVLLFDQKVSTLKIKFGDSLCHQISFSFHLFSIETYNSNSPFSIIQREIYFTLKFSYN